MKGERTWYANLKGLTGCDWVHDYDDIGLFALAALTAAAANDIHYIAVKPKVAMAVKELVAALSHNHRNEST